MPDFMGLDPKIPLGVHAGAPPAAGGEAGGFGQLGQVLGLVSKQAEIANQQNQNKLFQQTFAAKQRAGEIMAHAPSVSAGLDALVKDPVAGPFAGEYVMQMREAQMTQAQMGLIATQREGAVQEQSLNGYHAVLQGLAGTEDPSLLGPQIDAYLKTLSPQARARVAPAVSGVVKSLTEGLPDDPAAARDEFNSRKMGIAIASGNLAPDTAYALTGQLRPSIQTVTGPNGETQQVIVGGPANSKPDYLNNSVTGVSAYDPANPLVGAPGHQGAASGTNALGGGPAAANPRVLAVGPTAEQGEINKSLGEAAGDIQKDMSTVAATIPLQITRMNQIVDALSKFQSGGFADIRSEGGKILQGLRNAGLTIPQDMIDKVANGSIANSQEFTGLVKQLATAQLSIIAKGQGRVLKPEVEAALAQLDQTQDPNAVIGILNNIRAQYQVAADQSQKFIQFKRELAKAPSAQDPSVRGLHLADFHQWYNEQFQPDKLPTSLGGLNIGPIPQGVAAGTAPAGMPDYNSWKALQTKYGYPATLQDYAAASREFAASHSAGGGSAVSPTGKAAPDLSQFLKK